MRIPEGHSGGRVPQEVAHCGEGYAPHDEPAGECMPEVMAVEIRHARGLTRSVKVVADIIDPASIPDLLPDTGSAHL